MPAGTEKDAVFSDQRDERVDVEHGHGAVDSFFVLAQSPNDVILAAAKGRVVTPSALALPEHEFEQTVLGVGHAGAMTVELGPLLGHSVGVGDEVAMWDDAVDIVASPVPVRWPGYRSSGHFSFFGFLEKKL